MDYTTDARKCQYIFVKAFIIQELCGLCVFTSDPIGRIHIPTKTKEMFKEFFVIHEVFSLRFASMFFSNAVATLVSHVHRHAMTLSTIVTMLNRETQKRVNIEKPELPSDIEHYVWGVSW